MLNVGLTGVRNVGAARVFDTNQVSVWFTLAERLSARHRADQL